MDVRVGSKWILRKRLGSGSFGEIYSGDDMRNKEEIAVKLESGQCSPPQLLNEFRVYRMLAGGVGIPSVRWYGTEGDYNILVMDLLGESLEELFQRCGSRFSLKTVLMIADQMISRIQWMHEKSVLHRDIKPENFVIGKGAEQNVIHVIDLGLSKKYRDVKTGRHIGFRDGKALLGTARYTAANTHLGIEQSRRDDMEGIAYVLIYFLKGALPWMGIKAETKARKYELIGLRKMTIPIEVLCHGIPSEFATFLTEVRRLEFTDRPDYEIYRRMFRDLFLRQGYVYDHGYDWVQAVPRRPSIRSMVSGSLVLNEAEALPTPEPLLQMSRKGHPSAPIQQNQPSPKLPAQRSGDRPLIRPVPKPKVGLCVIPAGLKLIPRVIKAG
jgi:serine/threonine protein kinase